MATYKQQVADFAAAANKVVTTYGEPLGEQCGLAAQSIVLWIHWFRTHIELGAAPELLTGAEASIREAAASTAMGLGRSALTAIRTQMDLLLGYTYFRQHPAEWQYVCDTGEGFKLKSDILKYHSEYTQGFSERRGMLAQSKAPELNETYAKLSAHVHGQSKYSIPRAGVLVDLVWNEAKLKEVVTMQDRSATALSMTLLAIHANEWKDLPPKVVAEGRSVLTAAQEAIFFR